MQVLSPVDDANDIVPRSNVDLKADKTALDTKAPINSPTFTGTVTIPSGSSLIQPVPNNTVFSLPGGVNNIVTHDPIGTRLWHDRLAFNVGFGVPTFEQFNGTSWVSAALNSTPFAHLETSNTVVCDGTNTTGARWTWTNGNVSYSSVSAWLIGVAWNSVAPQITILIESSSDSGATRTTRHSSSATLSATVAKLFNTSWGGDGTLRLSLTVSNAAPIRITSIQALTTRWGDQGGGGNQHYPYIWDAARNITAPANLTVNGNLSVTGTTTGITKSTVGLSNVDNTSDANKPVSTAQQTALDAKVNANGITEIRQMTQAAYDALGTKSSSTLYVIVG